MQLPRQDDCFESSVDYEMHPLSVTSPEAATSALLERCLGVMETVTLSAADGQDAQLFADLRGALEYLRVILSSLRQTPWPDAETGGESRSAHELAQLPLQGLNGRILDVFGISDYVATAAMRK